MSKHTLTVDGHVHILTVGGCAYYVKTYCDSWWTCTLCQSILWQFVEMYTRASVAVHENVHAKAHYGDLWNCTCQSILWQFIDCKKTAKIVYCSICRNIQLEDSASFYFGWQTHIQGGAIVSASWTIHFTLCIIYIVSQPCSFVFLGACNCVSVKNSGRPWPCIYTHVRWELP